MALKLQAYKAQLDAMGNNANSVLVKRVEQATKVELGRPWIHGGSSSSWQPFSSWMVRCLTPQRSGPISHVVHPFEYCNQCFVTFLGKLSILVEMIIKHLSWIDMSLPILISHNMTIWPIIPIQTSVEAIIIQAITQQSMPTLGWPLGNHPSDSLTLRQELGEKNPLQWCSLGSTVQNTS